jgi:hypothetical protein
MNGISEFPENLQAVKSRDTSAILHCATGLPQLIVFELETAVTANCICQVPAGNVTIAYVILPKPPMCPKHTSQGGSLCTLFAFLL